MNEQKDQFFGTGPTNNRIGTTPPNQAELEIITGTLTSRIESKKDYHYAFFKSPNLVDPEAEFPVIFKGEKPTIPKGSQLQLTGTWSQGNGFRPSFTVTSYQILKELTSKLKTTNIYQKLCQIQASTGAISKSELNKFQNYKYFTEQQALNILKPLLAEQKLTLTFSDGDSHFACEKQEKDWAIQYRKKAILTNSETPEEQLTFSFWACGQNTDLAKAKGCAETYAIKYFLTKFFLIPTTDELDPDVTKDTEHLNRLKNGQKETPEQIQKRHEEKDLKRIAELKQKYGADWKLSQEYKLWKGNL